MTVKGPFPGKKGICFRLGKDENKPGSWQENLPKVLAADAYWTYTWGMEGYDVLQQHGGSDLMWVPMSWGHGPTKTVEDLKQFVESHQIPQLIEQQKVKLFLGFNEPDEEVQSNMKVDHAIKMWDALEALNVPLVSPSAAHPGKEWMEEFMDKAKRLNKRVDYLGVHWYGSCNFEAFKKQITEWHNKFHLPIIITEFASADWSARDVCSNRHEPCKILEFMKKALPWLEQTEWIAGYAWFSFRENFPPGCSSALYDSDGNLTALGKYYKSVRNDKPDGDRSIQAIEGKFHVTRGAPTIVTAASSPRQMPIQEDDDDDEVEESNDNDNEEQHQQQEQQARAFDSQSLIDQVCGAVCGSRI
jgi:Glycosyl hydrolase catalytic core